MIGKINQEEESEPVKAESDFVRHLLDAKTLFSVFIVYFVVGILALSGFLDVDEQMLTPEFAAWILFMGVGAGCLVVYSIFQETK